MASGLSSLESWLQPAAEQLVSVAAAAGLSPRVSSARRTYAQQALLYRRFLAGQSRFPAAPPGSSMHEIGLAFDLWINDPDQYEDLGTVWESLGGVWGGHFRDPIHFEAGGADGAVITPPNAPEGTLQLMADFGLDISPIGRVVSGVGGIAQMVAPSDPFYDVLVHPTKLFTSQGLSIIRRGLFGNLFG